MRRVLSALFFAVIFYLPMVAQAEIDLTKCDENGEHQTVTYLLIDRSDTLEDEQGFKKTIQVLKEMVQPGERLVIGVSADKAGDTKILMDLVNPVKSIWESTLKIRAHQKKFSECFDGVINDLLSQKEKHDHSAILETLLFVSKVVAGDSAPKKRIVLYSDMMQNSPSISFFTQKSLEPEPLLKIIQKERLMSELPKVDVYAAGTGAHVTDKKARELEFFWKSYVEKAGGTLKFYGPVLVNLS